MLHPVNRHLLVVRYFVVRHFVVGWLLVMRHIVVLHHFQVDLYLYLVVVGLIVGCLYRLHDGCCRNVLLSELQLAYHLYVLFCFYW